MEQLQALEVENSCIQATAASHRADFEREREQCENIIAETP
jgi:hypothetical protein